MKSGLNKKLVEEINKETKPMVESIKKQTKTVLKEGSEPKKLKDMEYTCRYAYSQAEKFIQKYGTVSGLEELTYRYNLRREEIEFICDKLIAKGKIEEYQKRRVLDNLVKYGNLPESIKEDKQVEKDGVKYWEDDENDIARLEEEARLVKEKWDTIDLRKQVTPELKGKWYYKQVSGSDIKVRVEKKSIFIDFAGDKKEIRLEYEEPTYSDKESWIKSSEGNLHIKKGQLRDGGSVHTKFYDAGKEIKVDLNNDSEYNTDFPIYQWYDGSKYSDDLNGLVNAVYVYIANYY